MYTRARYFSPYRIILLSLLFAIGLGTFLLTLPMSQLHPISLIDALFTATSSVCVTGLMTVPIDLFSPVGHCIIMILIQIGGLGLITLSLFVMSLFVDLGLATQVMAGEMFDLESWSGTKNLLIFIILFTLLCELVGSIFLFQTFKHHYPAGQAYFYALFHSISSFCNAGMVIDKTTMVLHAHNYLLLAITGFLMTLGGIGFITLQELLDHFNPFSKKQKRAVFSLQTKIILSYMIILTGINTFLFWLLEHKNTFESVSFPKQVAHSFFTALSCRGTGFLTVYANDMQQASLFTIIVNGFIGGAPGATSSGIKITTAAIIIATISAAINGKHSVSIKGRRLFKDQIYKAFAVVSLSSLWVGAMTFCLLITERSLQFIDIFFETVSAFSTLGVSIGITPSLSLFGKMVIIATMFAGRIGVLTLMIALRKWGEKNELHYPEERIMIS